MKELERLAQVLERSQESALLGGRLERLRPKVVDAAHAEWEGGTGGGKVFGFGHRKSVRWVNLVASAVVGACLAVLAIGVWPASPLSFRVAGQSDGPAPIGSWIESGGEGELPVWFSDGTVLEMQKNTRMKVAELAGSGAEVVVAEGSVRVAVAHRPRARWTLHVGPFDVRVTGTRFSVAWTSNVAEFVLSLDEGSVVVSGGCLERDRVMRKGDTLRTRCGTASGQTLSPIGAAPAPTAASSSAQVQAIEGQATALPSSKPVRPPGAMAVGTRLPASASRGADLAATATDTISDEVTAQHLLALADQARLAGDQQRATIALRRVRARHPGSPQAAVAAFDLGVIAYDTLHDASEAASWFDRYLQEAPAGPLRREALGRAVEARLRAGDEGGARRAAESYLRDYPNGPHAELARGVLRR